MVDASSLPSLFAASEHNPSGRFTWEGSSYLLASIDGVWTVTRDPDGVHVPSELFALIASGAAAGDGSLLLDMDGKIGAWEVAAQFEAGVRWLVLRAPGEE